MDKNQIINYIMQTPHNTSRAVLKSMLGDGNWDALYAYVEKTPHNMNRKVLESFFASSGGSDTNAVVGTAIVGQATI